MNRELTKLIKQLKINSEKKANLIIELEESIKYYSKKNNKETK
jgi:hypothetical protein